MFQRRCTKLHTLGARATAEILAEIAARTGRLDIVDDALSRYLRLTPDMLQATGGDRMAPAPLREVVS